MDYNNVNNNCKGGFYMRKYYLDNIRWAAVVIVVLYRVFYMYNAEGIVGVVGKITDLDVQYYDVFQYIVYPWIMVVLFIVSGISSKLYLDRHTDKEFIRSRTTRLLVPSTVGLFAFQFLQGFVNVSLGGFFERAPDIPVIAKFLICIASGIGVLWYIQLLWVFSLLLVLVRKAEKGRLWNKCRNVGLPVLIALAIPVYGAAQILNTPIIVVYRCGLYFSVFLIGAIILGAAFCIRYFGENYADKPATRSVLFTSYGYFASLAIIGGMAKYGDISNRFTQWMGKRSFGLYVFHYLGVSSVGLFLARPGYIPAPAAYLLSLIAGFVGGYLLNAVISRIPGYRWAVLGIKGDKKNVR